MAIEAVQPGAAAYAYPEKTKEGKGGMDYQRFLQEKIQELYEKFKKGESEPSYAIGAATYTQKEWDKLLEKFDALQDEIRAQMREEHERRAWQEEKTEKLRKEEQAVSAQDASLLSGAYTTATYPEANEKDASEHYITCYTADGIFCRRAGQASGYEWKIPFEKEGEYDKVMEFIGRFPQDHNLRFASHENFWQDFLNDRIDLDGFMKFMEGTDRGVPDYTVTDGESVFIDREKAAWAKYMNRGFGQFYTAQEMEQMLEEQIRENAARLPKLPGFFGKEGDGSEDAVIRRGKQSILDDVRAARIAEQMKGDGESVSYGAQAEKEPDAETESQIVVKPDGTRMLIITERRGQSVKVKSFKLSDPTDTENEGQKEGTESKAGVEAVETGDGRVATVSSDGSVQISAAHAADVGAALTVGTE